MYFDYLRERMPDLLILEREEGFALYKEVEFNEERMVYIQDIYVSPEHRESDIASQMSEEIQEIAKKEGIKYMLGTIVPSTENSHKSLQVLLAHGMTLALAEDDIIYFYKEII